MNSMRHALWVLLLAAASLSAQAEAVRTEHVEAELIAENTVLEPGSVNWLALRLSPEKGWHVYWQNPGDSGLPTTLRWTLPGGTSAGAIEWPYPQRQSLGDLTNYGYDAETLHPVPLSVAADATGMLKLAAEAKWLVCSDICIPGSASLTLDLPVSSPGSPSPPPADPRWIKAFADVRAKLPQASPWPARFATDGKDFSLAIEGFKPAPQDRIEFFPLASELVTHPAPQRIAAGDSGLRLSQALSSYFIDPPERVGGVLVVEHDGMTHAWQIDAPVGAVAAVAAAETTQPAISPAHQAGSPAADRSLPVVLLFALLGGLVLNLMPCVFPILSLKALSVMRAGETASSHRAHGLAYTAGVLASFAAIAGLMLALRSGGHALGWGFQLQSPEFVTLLIYVVFALGLSLSGLAQFGTRWMGLGQNLAARSGLGGSFFTGVLAVVVASPCTAPFMGVALGFALTQPAAVSLLVFLTLGLGLALPFLLLGFVPGLAESLPRPGAWMETLKQLLAFPLYLTAIWLVWVLGGLTDRDGMAVALLGLVLVAFALWLGGRATGGKVANASRYAALAAALALLAHPALTPLPPASATAPTHGAWQPYSDARLAELRDQGRTVFVDFTADWCISCKVNERLTLKSGSVQRAFEEQDVSLLKGDWTRSDPAITAVLQRYRRSGVPLYLVSRKGAEPVVLPQVLTPEIVIGAIR